MTVVERPKPIEFHVDVPELRVFRHLDVSLLDPNVEEKLVESEGRADYVDSDLPRDVEYTEEIMAATIGAAIVDSSGQIVHEWDGADAAPKAMKALSTARVKVELDFDGLDDIKPKAAKARKAPGADSAASLPDVPVEGDDDFDPANPPF